MERKRALEIVEAFGSRRVLVVGDLMADEHIWGHVHRVSPEAPVLVVDVEEETFVPGGAANTANQLKAFGAGVVMAGVVGADTAGESLRETLNALGIDTNAVVVSPDRPTTRKTRVVAGTQQGAQQVVRVDREKRTPLPADVASELVKKITEELPRATHSFFPTISKGF